MVFAVQYDYRFNYREINQKSFPIVQFRVSNPLHPELAVDIDCYLDSGAQYSLLNGWIAAELGLDLFSGTARRYGTTAGSEIEGRVHQVRLSHPDLGSFDLDVGLSTQQIRRDLLGRDFFDLIQIGFRERHLTFYVSPRP